MLTQDRPGPANPAKFVGYDRVIFLIGIGLAFLCFGAYHISDHGPSLFFAVLGVAFFIFGVSQFFMTKKFRENFGDKKD
jgi:hypothetical protein